MTKTIRPRMMSKPIWAKSMEKNVPTVDWKRLSYLLTLLRDQLLRRGQIWSKLLWAKAATRAAMMHITAKTIPTTSV